MVIWDYKSSPFLPAFNPLVREQRSGADLFYFDRSSNRRLAVDKIMLHGFSVEALISPEEVDFPIKLEDQVLITEAGFENLTRYSFDPRLS